MRVIVHNTRKDGIPILEYFIENRTYKGLVFVQHGYQSNKERGADFLALGLARLGYFVVAIDAFKHGERIQEPYITGTEIERMNEAYVVVKRTALDIVRIHHNHYNRFPKFDLIGVSLGGMVAYYLATRTDKIRKLVPLISTPDFLTQARHTIDINGLEKDTYFTPEMYAFMETINPLRESVTMHYESMFIGCGSLDRVVTMEQSVVFYNEHKDKNIVMKVYEVAHEVPRSMQKDVYDFLEGTEKE